MQVMVMIFCGAKGLCNVNISHKKRDNYGSGWVDPGFTRNLLLFENRPKIVLN